MIELYHFGFSTCSQKVRLVLAEKGIDFTSHEVNLIAGGQHDPAYVKLNPKHATAWFKLGLATYSVSTQEGSTVKAIEAKAPLEEYLKLDPKGEFADVAKALLAAIK